MDGAERRAEGGWQLGRRGLMTGPEGGFKTVQYFEETLLKDPPAPLSCPTPGKTAPHQPLGRM